MNTFMRKPMQTTHKLEHKRACLATSCGWGEKQQAIDGLVGLGPSMPACKKKKTPQKKAQKKKRGDRANRKRKTDTWKKHSTNCSKIVVDTQRCMNACGAIHTHTQTNKQTTTTKKKNTTHTLRLKPTNQPTTRESKGGCSDGRGG